MKDNWTPDDNYSRYYLETDDPRLLLIVEREESGDNAPDGDSLAPAYWLNHRNYPGATVTQAGSTFEDDYAMAAYQDALGRFSDEDTAERFMRIFHDTTIERLNQRGDTLVLLNTPAFRQHVGIDNPDGTRAQAGGTADRPGDSGPIDDSIALSLDGERETWRAYLDGEVYGVGYAIRPERTTNESTPLQLTPDSEEESDLDSAGWEVNLECWGFYGLEYAQQESASEGYLPMLNLPPMLPFTNPIQTAA